MSLRFSQTFFALLILSFFSAFVLPSRVTDLGRTQFETLLIPISRPTYRIAGAIRAYWTDSHNLAEGAGAAPLAAALQQKPRLAGKKVGLVLSGGNIDFDLFVSRVVGPTAGERR